MRRSVSLDTVHSFLRGSRSNLSFLCAQRRGAFTLQWTKSFQQQQQDQQLQQQHEGGASSSKPAAIAAAAAAQASVAADAVELRTQLAARLEGFQDASWISNKSNQAWLAQTEDRVLRFLLWQGLVPPPLQAPRTLSEIAPSDQGKLVFLNPHLLGGRLPPSVASEWETARTSAVVLRAAHLELLGALTRATALASDAQSETIAVTGAPGCGKSSALVLLAAAAVQSECVTLWVPHAKRELVFSPHRLFVAEDRPGVFYQPQVARELFESLLRFEPLLKTIPLQIPTAGAYDASRISAGGATDAAAAAAAASSASAAEFGGRAASFSASEDESNAAAAAADAAQTGTQLTARQQALVKIQRLREIALERSVSENEVYSEKSFRAGLPKELADALASPGAAASDAAAAAAAAGDASSTASASGAGGDGGDVAEKRASDANAEAESLLGTERLAKLVSELGPAPRLDTDDPYPGEDWQGSFRLDGTHGFHSAAAAGGDKTLFDLVQFGASADPAANPNPASLFYHLVDELQLVDAAPVVVAIDAANAFDGWTPIRNAAYERIHARQLSVVDALAQLQRPGSLRRGVAVFAHSKRDAAGFVREEDDVKRMEAACGSTVCVDNAYTRDENDAALRHYVASGVLSPSAQRNTLLSAMSGGRPGEVWKVAQLF